jgi:DNA-binding response OmpR family regulator
MMRLLLVEDDPILGNGIEAGLRQAGFAVDWVQDGRSAQLALETTAAYELVVLDLGLPRVTGMDLLRQLRARGSDLPVLILTARDTVRDRVTGLEAGGDDYLIKPFALAELVARIRALLRRAHGRSIDAIRHGDMVLAPDGLTVTRGEEAITLSARECAILVDLLEHRGTALSRARLEESLYGWGEEIESNAVEVHIHNLRKKLGSDLIKTIRGVGYLISKEAP